jgi:ADP-ribose pyrophosphatase
MKNKHFDSSGDTQGDLTETTISSEHVFDGELLQVYVDRVELPNGATSTRDWIRHPGASAVVPVFEDGTVMLVKQFRYPPRRTFAEVPAGKIDPGETPLSTAQRELTEESGLVCKNLEPAGSFFPAIGYADEEIFVYVGWDISREEKNSDSDEFLENYRVPFSTALSMIEKGEIKDGKTICALTQAYFWWLRNSPFEVNFTADNES